MTERGKTCRWMTLRYRICGKAARYIVHMQGAAGDVPACGTHANDASRWGYKTTETGTERKEAA